MQSMPIGPLFNGVSSNTIFTCRILAKKLNVPWQKLHNLSELQNELQSSLEDIIAQTDKLLPKERYTRDDVIQELEITSDELNQTILTPNTVHLESFKIRQRALHVFEGKCDCRHCVFSSSRSSLHLPVSRVTAGVAIQACGRVGRLHPNALQIDARVPSKPRPSVRVLASECQRDDRSIGRTRRRRTHHWRWVSIDLSHIPLCRQSLIFVFSHSRCQLGRLHRRAVRLFATVPDVHQDAD